MASPAEINRFLSQKLTEENLEEIDAISAGQWLNDEGLLKDSLQRPGLPLRKLLRAGKINGSFQYPNRRWVIRQSNKETAYSVRETATELGLTEHAIYKRIERGLLKPEKLGEKSIVIPKSEIIREQQIRNNPTNAINRGQFHDPISTVKQKLVQIQGEMNSLINTLSDLEMTTGEVNKNSIYNNITELKKNGFEGFVTIESFQQGKLSHVPEEKGVYLVLYLSDSNIEFIKKSSAGHFKGKNPTVHMDILEKKWIENTIVAYIGQAGGGDSSATLKSRIRQLVAFGNGKPIGHWGGRYLWQIKDSKDLVICWQASSKRDPRTLENELIRNFVSHHGALPFANLKE